MTQLDHKKETTQRAERRIQHEPGNTNQIEQKKLARRIGPSPLDRHPLIPLPLLCFV